MESKSILQKLGYIVLFVMLCASVIAGYMFMRKSGKSTFSATQPVLSQSAPTITARPTSPLQKYLMNTTQQWVTYANSQAPFTIQYPPQWGYHEDNNSKFDGTGTTIPLYAVSFKQQNSVDNNIYIIWGNGLGGIDPSSCFSQPSVHLKTVTITGCEYKLDNGNDAMELWGPLHFRITIFSTPSVTINQLLSILSTLIPTK